MRAVHTDFSLLHDYLAKVAHLVELPEELECLKPESSRFQQIANQRVNENNGYLDEVVKILESFFELNRYNNNIILATPKGGGRTTLRDIAHWLLAQARNREPHEVITQLIAFIKNDSVPMSEILAIWGLNPIKAVDFGDNIQLVSLNSLPPSIRKDQFTGIQESRLPFSSIFPGPLPRAALKWDFNFSPIASGKTESPFLQSKRERMEQIAKCLCLLNTPASIVGYWYQCDMNTPVIGGVRSSEEGFAIEHAFKSRTDETDYDSIEINKILTQFENLSDKDKRRFEIPLTRLNKALRSFDNSEKALELGIAVESLIAPTKEEISYQIRLKGAYLLGGSTLEKKYNFELIKKLYDLRSTIAHGNSLGEKIKFRSENIETGELLKKMSILCSELMRAILKRGKFIDDWDGALLGW